MTDTAVSDADMAAADELAAKILDLFTEEDPPESIALHAITRVICCILVDHTNADADRDRLIHNIRAMLEYMRTMEVWPNGSLQ